MAYAEKPYRDSIHELGKVASVSSEAITALDKAAAQASNEVGLSYVAVKQQELDTLREQLGQGASPETEASLERDAKPIIEALEKRYPGSTFELIGDTVVCVDPNGIDLGDPTKDYDKNRSWGTVMENPNDECFKLAVGGQQYDARTGMTTEVYTAMVEKAKASGRELPDSKANQLDNGWYTWTLLTGDPLTADGVAPCAWVDVDGSVVRDGADLDDVYRDIRFRPAVKVATDEKR